MTDARRTADFSSLEDAQAHSIRRDADDDESVQVVGYIPGSERARAFPGDDKFPFVKDVPDVTGPDEYRKSFLPAPSNPLPLAAQLSEYETLCAIDVRGQRGFVLMGIYLPSFGEGGGAGTLSLICEASLAPFTPTGLPNDVWVPIGVVNPTLVTPAIAPGFAYRNFFASEFRLNPWFGFVPPFPEAAPIPFTLVFDVSWYRKVRVRVADVVTDQAYLDLRYFRQR